MSPPDDILGETSATESAKPGTGGAKPDKTPAVAPPRVIGPESEDRGGPEAPADSLDDGSPDHRQP
ncbi:MAG: hypothetical protein ACJ8AI_34640 [Rhodopila sp.]